MGRVKELVYSDKVLEVIECLFCHELKGYYRNYVEHYLIYQKLKIDSLPPYSFA